jgi:hypothetical protein
MVYNPGVLPGRFCYAAAMIPDRNGTKAQGLLNASLPLARLADARALAQAIVDTVREPLLVLDQSLSVVAASRSYYATFLLDRQDVEGRAIYAVGNGQWDIPELRTLLESILPEHAVMEGYQVEHDFAATGHRSMLLNARTVFFEDSPEQMILLAMEDVTEWRAAERASKDLLDQTEVLLQEMQHRVANSLQIIASILMLKARAVVSEETRLAFARRASARHVGCRRPATAPGIAAWGYHRTGAVPAPAVRDAG